ncbi:MAG TPA: aldehyde dehydrogenase [Actinobacteria bacterium]|nr:aldehyde dehydrogenase [Actinomycetota bacterium]
MTTTPSQSVEVPETTQLIDGEWSPAPVELGTQLENPNTGEAVAQMRGSTDDDVERAAAAAWRVHESGAWLKIPAQERADMLEKVADALDAAAPQVAALESFGTAAVISTTAMLAGVINGGSFRLAAGLLRDGRLMHTVDGPTGKPAEVHRLPWGPALSLVPWNAPAPQGCHKIANSLAVGAPTILKPSEWAPYGTTLVAEVIAKALDEAGAPQGTFQLVQGNSHVGGRLVKDQRIRSISFTGGLVGGQAIAAACAPDFKPAQLELGGNNPVVVLDDADLDGAATGITELLTQLNGQWCRALGRLIIQGGIYDDLMAAVLEKFGQLVIGDSLSAESQMGPIVHSGHLSMLKGRIAEYEAKGGKAHSSSSLPDLPGNFLAPTLITGVSSADAQEEIFGPVATVHRAADDAEALALANGTPFGLEGYVFAGDEERGMALARQVRAGGVKVNGSTMLSLNLMAPRPAWGLSGLGVEGTTETFDFFTNPRVVGVENLSAAALKSMFS